MMDYVEEPMDCPAALNILGEHFPCDVESLDPDGKHPGLAHANRKALAIWRGDEEI